MRILSDIEVESFETVFVEDNFRFLSERVSKRGFEELKNDRDCLSRDATCMVVFYLLIFWKSFGGRQYGCTIFFVSTLQESIEFDFLLFWRFGRKRFLKMPLYSCEPSFNGTGRGCFTV